MRSPFLLACLLSANAFACGGGDLTDEQVSASAEIKAVQEKILHTYGKAVGVESIVRSGNSILDLDKKEVARAMCAANYLNVYLPGEGLRCMITLDVNRNGVIDSRDLRAECRPDGSASQLVLVPFKRR